MFNFLNCVVYASWNIQYNSVTMQGPQRNLPNNLTVHLPCSWQQGSDTQSDKFTFSNPIAPYQSMNNQYQKPHQMEARWEKSLCLVKGTD